MYPKPWIGQIIMIAIASLAAHCMGQKLQADRGFAPATALDVTATENAVPTAAAVASTTPPTAPFFFVPRSDVAVFALGNFNPATDIIIHNTPHLAVSSNKSSLGGSAEYRHWFSARNALGILYAQNPSDGKLLWQGQNYIWPQMRRDFSLLATQEMAIGRFLPFLDEGPGVVVTNGYSNCGWSAGFALVAGLGADFQISRRFSARTGITFLDTSSGCYDDHTCRETWGVVKDLRVGLVYKWGARESSLLAR
jgi:hypothetical protein